MTSILMLYIIRPVQANNIKYFLIFSISVILLFVPFGIKSVSASESPVLTPPSLSVLTATPSASLTIIGSSYGTVTSAGGNAFVISSPQPSVTTTGLNTISSSTATPIQTVQSSSPNSISGKTSPCPPIGDINDDKVITNDDSQAVLQNIARLSPYQNLTADQIKRADVNGDAKISVADATLILRYVAGLNSTFKACIVSPAFASAQTVTAAPVTVLSAPVSPVLQLSSASATPITPTPSPIASPSSTPIAQPTLTPTPTATPTSQPTPTSTPTSNPTPPVSPSPSSTPTPTITPSPAPSNNVSGSVSLVPPITTSPVPSVTSGGVIAVNGLNSYSGNDGIVSLVPAKNSTPNILTTGINFIIEGFRWGLGLFGII